jgi:hypothetical protein
VLNVLVVGYRQLWVERSGEKLLTTAQAAEHVGISRGTVARYTRDGLLNPTLTGPTATTAAAWETAAARCASFESATTFDPRRPTRTQPARRWSGEVRKIATRPVYQAIRGAALESNR